MFNRAEHGIRSVYRPSVDRSPDVDMAARQLSIGGYDRPVDRGELI